MRRTIWFLLDWICTRTWIVALCETLSSNVSERQWEFNIENFFVGPGYITCKRSWDKCEKHAQNTEEHKLSDQKKEDQNWRGSKLKKAGSSASLSFVWWEAWVWFLNYFFERSKMNALKVAAINVFSEEVLCESEDKFQLHEESIVDLFPCNQRYEKLKWCCPALANTYTKNFRENILYQLESGEDFWRKLLHPCLHESQNNTNFISCLKNFAIKHKDSFE